MCICCRDGGYIEQPLLPRPSHALPYSDKHVLATPNYKCRFSPISDPGVVGQAPSAICPLGSRGHHLQVESVGRNRGAGRVWSATQVPEKDRNIPRWSEDAPALRRQPVLGAVDYRKAAAPVVPWVSGGEEEDGGGRGVTAHDPCPFLII